jgi:hypothetical protein
VASCVVLLLAGVERPRRLTRDALATGVRALLAAEARGSAPATFKFAVVSELVKRQIVTSSDSDELSTGSDDMLA